MNIWIICLEKIDGRYTQQWYYNIPRLIADAALKKVVDVNIVTVDGEDIPQTPTSGAILDFASTNYYKASQAIAVSKLFMDDKVKSGDKFLVTDGWNFVITPIKYMSELLGIPVEIHSIFHAGAYDPSDILGMKMSRWAGDAERSWFYASDYSYFATEFHRGMFLRNLNIDSAYHDRAVRSGQPHDPIIDDLTVHLETAKQKRVMWPHRYNSDKQPEIAEALGETFDFVITQKMSLSKDEYYRELGSSQVIFSCSLHENLGISMMEATLAGCIPVLPNRCSYSEMYEHEFLYPSQWTSSVENFKKFRTEIEDFIRHRLDHPEQYEEAMKRQRARLIRDYLNADITINNLLK